MSPGLPASKLLAVALNKTILTRVFILWKVFASSFSPHVSSSFLVASDIIPPAEKTKGMKRPLVRGLALIARLSICSRYFVLAGRCGEVEKCQPLDWLSFGSLTAKEGVFRVLRRPVIRPDVQLLRLAIVAEGGD